MVGGPWFMNMCIIGSSCMDGIGHRVAGVHLGCTWLDIPRKVATGSSIYGHGGS